MSFFLYPSLSTHSLTCRPACYIDWEMRGARGIEFGVDIPAIPAIGLGSLPLASSLSNLTRAGTHTNGRTGHVQGDGWGFGDWTRFVGAWKKNKDQEVADKAAGAVHEHHKHSPEETKAHDASTNSPLSASSSLLSAVETSAEGSAALKSQSPLTRKAAASRRADKEDDVVKLSTDTLSVVFDWLIERVPAPAVILRRSSPGDSGKGKAKEKASAHEPGSTSTTTSSATNNGASDKDLSALAVAHMVHDSRSSRPPAPPLPPSEMKRRMEREDKGRGKQKELASREDLQRFYIALARKMYDAGL